MTSLSERERKPVVYGAGLLMMVREVNGETTGGLLTREGPMGVQCPDLWPVWLVRSDQRSPGNGKLAALAIRALTTGRDGILHHAPERCPLFDCEYSWEPKKTETGLCECVRTHKKTHKQELSHVAACVKPAIYTEDDKESQAEGAKCPEAGWLALATQAVCGHAGALEQPSAPDEHVSTQTYRKNQATPHSLSFTPRQANSHLNNKLLSTFP